MNHSGLDGGDPYLVSREDSERLWWAGSKEDMPVDIQRSEQVHQQIKILTPERQFEKFLLAMLQHHNSEIQDANLPHASLATTSLSTTASPSSSNLSSSVSLLPHSLLPSQPNTTQSHSSTTTLTSAATPSQNYLQQVFLPVVVETGKKKRFYPIFKLADSMFGDYQLLLHTTVKAYATAKHKGEEWCPAVWQVAFWSLAYRLIGCRRFFDESFDHRLPFPEEDDTTVLGTAMTKRKPERKKIFGVRYINQGVDRTIIALQAFLKSMRSPTAQWTSANITPSIIYNHLVTLPHVSDFYAWQVRRKMKQNKNRGTNFVFYRCLAILDYYILIGGQNVNGRNHF